LDAIGKLAGCAAGVNTFVRVIAPTGGIPGVARPADVVIASRLRLERFIVR